MELPDKFLIPEEDGLPMRPTQDYVHYKLDALTRYVTITNNSMYKKWPHRWFLDLQAGPGKNNIGNMVVFGSPLIALTAPHPATHFIFNDADATSCEALARRVSTSPLRDRVEIHHADMNEIATKVCDKIHEHDRQAKAKNKWSSLNMAFLDPEGLELHWSTVEQLAQVNRMDLIINFSTGGISRSIGRGNHEAVNRFFGTSDWRDIYNSAPERQKNRALIDLYLSRLAKFGYQIEIDPEFGSGDVVVKNSKNAHIYSMIFASKHPLGEKFWKEAGISSEQPKLPGLDL